MEERMERRPGSRVIVWLVVIVAVLVLIPLVGMIAMMTMGGMMGGSMVNGQMGGDMAGMMGMHGWGLIWMVLLAVVLIALIFFVVRSNSRT
jgi:uncharacterized BrkB/YihY/UPF0761 family membrane protein